jgi:hypothetical protein
MSCGAEFWLAENCVSHPRMSSGVVVILRYLNKWLAAKSQTELGLEDFVSLLRDKGYEVKEVAGTLLVCGLGSAKDWKWERRFISQ